LELGDERWRELLDSHHEIVRTELDRFNGSEVDTAGDGFLATFDGPARAVRCAMGIADAVQRLGIQIRAGAHTGEIEVSRDDVRGIAVHIGARVMALANGGEVMVSQTVKDLVAGSGLIFEDAGEHELKGVPATPRSLSRRRGDKATADLTSPQAQGPPGPRSRFATRSPAWSSRLRDV
jgi:class 3 adenylate cyclase